MSATGPNSSTSFKQPDKRILREDRLQYRQSASRYYGAETERDQSLMPFKPHLKSCRERHDTQAEQSDYQKCREHPHL
ncbi:hypothetical protein [Pseudomonas sp. Irchel s3b5]|uniref:hypothetical protein n=1 Tax=Pseudomonas sp. Irchel s3b5 TaxID=2009077 RepID=UPI0011799D0C|nr:hypothetical protein [Pseudomonas sp. Irchel s3b5]